MKNAIMRSTFGYLYALLIFAILPPLPNKWSLLILTLVFIPGWWLYELIAEFLKGGKHGWWY
jgi:hypothetical protein